MLQKVIVFILLVTTVAARPNDSQSKKNKSREGKIFLPIYTGPTQAPAAAAAAVVAPVAAAAAGGHRSTLIPAGTPVVPNNQGGGASFMELLQFFYPQYWLSAQVQGTTSTQGAAGVRKRTIEGLEYTHGDPSHLYGQGTAARTNINTIPGITPNLPPTAGLTPAIAKPSPPDVLNLQAGFQNYLNQWNNIQNYYDNFFSNLVNPNLINNLIALNPFIQRSLPTQYEFQASPYGIPLFQYSAQENPLHYSARNFNPSPYPLEASSIPIHQTKASSSSMTGQQ